MRVAIVGGGVMGCASALALRVRGADVVVLERSVPGAEASSAAAGILGAQAESHGPGPMVDAFVRARGEYEAWARALRERSGIDVGFRRSGVLVVGRGEQEREGLAGRVVWQRAAGLTAELVDGAKARPPGSPTTRRSIRRPSCAPWSRRARSPASSFARGRRCSAWSSRAVAAAA
jgi:glycine oxidase